jgi:hypothetical protein
MQVAVTCFAASTTISFSKSNVKIGDEVTVTVRFSGSDIAGVQFSISYDSSILTYKSCSGATYSGGTAVWYDDSSSVSSHSVSFSFKANKTGSTTISVSNVSVANSSGNPISGFSGAAATMTVSSNETTTAATTTKAPETTTKKQETTTKKQETTTKKEETTTETTTEEEKDNEITLNSKVYTLVDDSAFVDAPDGFDETYSDYKGGKILTYTSKDKSQQIVCLMDADGKKIFALFDDEKDSFSEYIKIKSSTLPLILVTPKEGVIPSSYSSVKVKINDNEVSAYQNEEFKAKGLHLIYALNLDDGKAGLYVYDGNDKTIQRYYGLSVNAPDPETTTEEKTTEAQKTQDIPFEKSTMVKLICALGVLLLAAFIAIVTLAIKLKKKGENADDVGMRIIEKDDDGNIYFS